MTTIIDLLGTSTPVSDAINRELGLIKSAILCRIFFHQQLRDNVCRVSNETLRISLGLSAGAISQNLKWLFEEGWIINTEPLVKGGRPNYYKVTDKFFDLLERSRDESNVHEVNVDVQQMNVNVHEVKGEEELKEDIEEKESVVIEQESEFSRLCKLYQQEIGGISQIISDSIKDDLKIYPPEWIIEAIKRAALANVRKYNYIQGILKNWKAIGGPQNEKPRKSSRQQYNGNGNSNGRPPGLEPGRSFHREMTPEERAEQEQAGRELWEMVKNDPTINKDSPFYQSLLMSYGGQNEKD